MPFREDFYRQAVRVLRGLSPLFASGESKLARGIRGRRGAAHSLVSWARASRNLDRPLIWFHAPSVGEGFQARAVAEALRALRPDAQIAYTYFSPSAVGFAEGMPADVHGFLPWDLPGEVGPVLDALRPELVAFTKTEVWPTLSRQCEWRDVSTALVAGTLPPGAGRLRGPARWLLRPAFGRLAVVAAIADADAERFSRLGVPPDRVTVTGDPGVDSAVARLEEAERSAPYLEPFRSVRDPVLVAGSTWETDEAVLIPAASGVRDEMGAGSGPGRSGLFLVFAPHEPTEIRVASLIRALEEAGWSPTRLGEVESRGRIGDHDAVVVDRVGVLAHLYTVGTVAYVGGGFHDEGLHSVLEPAAAGIPVLFGPGHDNARAAADLLEAGGARTVDSVSSLQAALAGWIEGPDAAASAGGAARAYLETHRGAAERTARILLDFVKG